MENLTNSVVPVRAAVRRRLVKHFWPAPALVATLVTARIDLLVDRQYGVALSLAGSPGRSINRELGPPDNCQLPAVLLALFVGCLPLAAVEAGER
jgi:hypothetical protein